MRTWFIFAMLASLCLLSHAQVDVYPQMPLSIGPSYRIHPSDVTQSEVFIARDPSVQDVMFTCCNTISFVPFLISEGIYVTENSGDSWRGSDTCNGYPIGFHGGDPGITIDRNGTFILTRMGRTPFVGLYSHFSTDRGLTWSDQVTVSTDDLERAALASDAVAESPYEGRSYAVWTTLSQPFPLMFSYTEGGQTFSPAMQVNNPAGRCAGGDVAVGPGGVVYTCWAGVTSASPFKEVSVGFASSQNGGASWLVTENAFAVNGITGLLEEKGNIRVNGLPVMAVDTNQGPRKGWIYIVTGQKDLLPAGTDPDIILYRSTDGGHTWSAGLRVNQDPLNDGKIQYFPNIHIDRTGAVDILFYDDRTTTSDSAGVFLARSADGGDTWLEYEVSDHHFKPAAIGGLGQGYQGDVIDLTSTDSKIWPVWMDNSSGIYQVWTAPVNIAGLGFGDRGNDSSNEECLHIAPNPFRNQVSFSYIIKHTCPVSITLYDVFGRRLSTLDEGTKPPGNYSVRHDPDLQEISTAGSSGLCICRFQAGTHVEYHKLFWLK